MTQRWLRRRAARIDENRVASIASYLKEDEVVLTNTSARLLPDVEGRGLGTVYLSNARLLWHLPDAVASGTGGLPYGVIDAVGFEDDLLGVRIAGVDSTRVLLFQLYPGPISQDLVERLVGSAAAARQKHGLSFKRSSDPLGL